MPTQTAIPVTITPEAAAHIQKLAMQRELEMMIEHTLQTIPGLRELHVVLEPPYDTGEDDSVVLEAVTPPTDDVYNACQVWGSWFDATFSPEVRQHFCLYPTAEASS